MPAMNRDPLYLRQNVQVEPLVDAWYAWPLLIPPATLARVMTQRHLPIMTSYISAPATHAQAVKNPKLLGGPFIDLDGKRVDEIRALRDCTKGTRTALGTLSEAIAGLDQMLRTQAKGHSLHPLYERVPEALRGYVELFYDRDHHPSYRLIEPLLYKSPLYDRSLQSLMLSLITGDDRPFVLSTPRLPTPGLVHWQVPFDDERVDWLFELKHQPQPWAVIKDVMGLPDAQDEALQRLLTSDPPPAYKPYHGPGVRWRYFGHACILVETASISLLFDPVLSYTYESGISRFTYADLPDRIDYVFITHNHQDHILFETLLQLRRRVGTVVVPRNGSSELQDPSLKLLLQNIGFSNVIELSELETLTFDGGSVVGLPFFGEHADLDVRTKMAYLVNLLGHSMLFAADSCNIEPRLYERIHDAVGDIDALFVGMECDGAPLSWLYGALMTKPVERAMDESRRLSGSDYAQAIDIVNRFHCRDVYVYAMGQEPWLNYVMSLKYTDESRPIVHSNQLIEECRARGLCAERLFGEKEIFLDAALAAAG
jgi:L-ascorbate metabolism protein UlaG (beta-lactamase superfamily)